MWVGTAEGHVAYVSINLLLLSLFFFEFCIFQFPHGAFGDLWLNSPTAKLLEIQLQNAVREQQQLATRLIRTGIQQAQSASNQLEVAKAIQSTAANTLASKGLFDVRRWSICVNCPSPSPLSLLLFAAKQYRTIDFVVRHPSMLSAESLYIRRCNQYG